MIAEPIAPHGVSDPSRLAKLYRKRIAPTSKVFIHKLSYDTYGLRAIPEDVRREYEEKRKAVMEPLLEELENLWKTPTPPPTLHKGEVRGQKEEETEEKEGERHR